MSQFGELSDESRSLKARSREFLPPRKLEVQRSQCCDAPPKLVIAHGKTRTICSKCGKPTVKNTKPRDSS